MTEVTPSLCVSHSDEELGCQPKDSPMFFFFFLMLHLFQQQYKRRPHAISYNCIQTIMCVVGAAVVVVVVVVACESSLCVSCSIMRPGTLKLDSVKHLPKVE